jgi:hypothetical protein
MKELLKRAWDGCRKHYTLSTCSSKTGMGSACYEGKQMALLSTSQGPVISAVSVAGGGEWPG